MRSKESKITAGAIELANASGDRADFGQKITLGRPGTSWEINRKRTWKYLLGRSSNLQKRAMEWWLGVWWDGDPSRPETNGEKEDIYQAGLLLLFPVEINFDYVFIHFILFFTNRYFGHVIVS